MMKNTSKREQTPNLSGVLPGVSILREAKTILSTIAFLIISIAFFSCRDDAQLRKKVSGKAGEIAIVIPKETWEGEVGKAMRVVLQQPQVALPQEEPIFNLIDVPPVAFKDLFKSHRNIINTRISPTLDSSKVEFRRDVWAWPQAVINIQARTPGEFISLFDKYSDNIVSYILKAERERLHINYEKIADIAIRNKVTDKFGMTITVPRGFVVANEGSDFLWLRYDTNDITQGILIYTFPYVSDSTFTMDYLVQRRDSFLMMYVEGPTTGNMRTYMSTELQVPPVLNFLTFNNKYAAEMRGLWKIERAFMGGPFVNLSILDEANNRVVVLEGFVYAPRFDKRNYLRQVEAIIYSANIAATGENVKTVSGK